MRSIRIAHIADTHLGYRSATVPGRDEDFARSWVAACRAIVNSKPDLILHAGDVFHRPNPTWSALRDFLDGASILEEAGVPIFMISGNHDSSRLVTKHTVFSVLTEVVPHITISYHDKPQYHFIDELDVEVVLLSHQALLSKTLRDDLRSTLEAVGRGTFSILVAHGGIGDLEEYREQGSIVIPDFVFDYPWSYVALGHLHVAQAFGRNGWYSGSIERCGWTDRFADPAWTACTVSEGGWIRHEQVELPHRMMVQLPDLDCGGSDEVDIAGEALNRVARVQWPNDRAVARIKLNGVHPFARRSLQSSLQRLVKENYPQLLFQVEVDGSHSVWLDPRDYPEGKESKSVEDMFADFVESRVFDDPSTRVELLRVGNDAISRVRAAESLRDEL